MIACVIVTLHRLITASTTSLYQVVFQGTSVAAATGLKLTYKGWRGSDTSRPELTSAQMKLLPFLARDLARCAEYLPLKKRRNEAFSEYFIKWAQVDMCEPVSCCCCCCCCCCRSCCRRRSEQRAARRRRRRWWLWWWLVVSSGCRYHAMPCNNFVGRKNCRPDRSK